MKQIANGRRPKIPARCPEPLAQIMLACWEANPALRPTSGELLTKLRELENQNYTSMLDTTKKQSVEDNSRFYKQATTFPWVVPFADITLGEEIGQGSLGRVYEAKFQGQKVAVKMLRKALVGKDFYESLFQELKMLSSAQHPNIVGFRGAIVEKDHRAIIMEFCDKGDLFQFLHDHTVQIDYVKVIEILEGIAKALLYLHERNLVHRDLKSLNVLLMEDWSVKVADIGLSDIKHSNRVCSAQLGTPFYLAPEVMEQETFSPASDVYSFGMIMWEMFTRKVPFTDLNPHQAALAVIMNDKRPEIPTYVPSRYSDLIQACWQKDPSARPTMPHILQTLSQLKQLGIPRLELDRSNSGLYQKKTRVFAFQAKDVVIVYKQGMSTQSGMRSKKNDWIVVGQDDDVYTCDDKVFQNTYGLVPGTIQQYRKSGKIRAKKMPEQFLIETLEGMEYGMAHDYLVQNTTGIHEQWPIKKAVFERMYALVDEDLEDAQANVLKLDSLVSRGDEEKKKDV